MGSAVENTCENSPPGAIVAVNSASSGTLSKSGVLGSVASLFSPLFSTTALLRWIKGKKTFCPALGVPLQGLQRCCCCSSRQSLSGADRNFGGAKPLSLMAISCLASGSILHRHCWEKEFVDGMIALLKELQSQADDGQPEMSDAGSSFLQSGQSKEFTVHSE